MGARSKAPVHDHLVWGLVGIYEGAIEETRYRKIDNDNDSDGVPGIQLEIIDTVIAKKNDISFVYPPNADIHGVRNPFKDQAVTIHIYGTDIGKQQRHSYHDNSINSILTPHANTTAVYTY
ncbi:cysteine dioxygenase family protein [Bacillus sp. T3]|uniref:cysteine dioxygenase family protein n=1 Tax=Bacillus sp. T3 TaxID=467262 RepID=UPI002981186D|nr:cysteine dioxygenase family protein [Bacillus sp. T3]